MHYFISEWDNQATDQHLKVMHWPKRSQFMPGTKNIAKYSKTFSEKEKCLIISPTHKIGHNEVIL